jgi:OOP family OmpA-OmpF porin
MFPTPQDGSRLMKVFLICLGVVASVWFTAAPAQAETRAGEWSISPVIGGYLFEADEYLKHKPVYGARLGYNLTSRFALEGAFDYLRTESKLAPVDVDGYLYRLEGLWHLRPDAKVVPYLAAGLGVIKLDPESGNFDEDFLLDYGIGAKWALNRAIGLRADVRHIMAQHNSPTYNNLEYTLGLVFSWGGAKATPMSAAAEPPPPQPAAAPPPPAPVPLPPVDEDRDGVVDSQDRCPGTPSGIPVGADGCPADRDQDGVPDSDDRCPATAPGTPVDSQGCPLDGDKDGVADAVDRCPDTPPGESVDETGCLPPPAEEKVSIELAIAFDTNKAEIKPQYQSEVQRVAEFMKTAPKTTGEVEGHTDNVGSEKANVALSQRRADAVRDALIKLGVEASRLTAKGYGPSNPIADNKTADGRRKNRRVVVTISGVK